MMYDVIRGRIVCCSFPFFVLCEQLDLFVAGEQVCFFVLREQLGYRFLTLEKAESSFTGLQVV